ncbi:MAG TPA: Spy/CpxP family protein refolding chaperone [Acidobacteriota bacterium]|nr:Spy/CpxP family protein refolding chaperone [Acidobacteriota bacterium]HNH84809.1 Spy/CpxP family protein refolding chaperone [Acidobacteriota bacterium]HNJ40926.1 Spy/CpxP family protein refolding chaperone [Acidobacteriota bacterium]
MKKQLLFLFGSVAVLGAVLLSTFLPQTFAFGQHPERRGMKDRRAQFAQELNLTDAQKSEMKTLMAREHQALKPIFQQLSQFQDQIRNVNADGQFHEAEVRPLAEQQAKLMTSLQLRHIETRSQMQKILTAEQLQKAESLRPNFDRGFGPMPFMGAHQREEQMARVLGLTPEQEAQIQTNLEADRPVVSGLLQQLKTQQQQIQTLTTTGADQTQINALLDQQTRTLTDLIVQRERTRLKNDAILTPEQRATAEALHDRMKMMMGERFGRPDVD